MANVFLPEHLEEVSIKDMIAGEIGYTVPWAMYAERDGSLWLNGNYSFRGDPGGTVQMIIERTGGGYAVDISRVDKSMRHWSSTGPHYSGEFPPLPVVELRGN